MTYSILDGKLVVGESGQVSIFTEAYQPDQPPQDCGAIPPQVFAGTFTHKSSHFESHESFDLVCYEPVDILRPDKASSPICIFLERDHMHVYAPDEALVARAFQAIMEAGTDHLTPGTLLYAFLCHSLAGDREKLEQMESSLNALEEEVLTGEMNDRYNRRFMVLRKHLVRVRRYYEQLAELVDGLSANENGLFDKRSLRQFSMLDGQVSRRLQKVAGMLDYVSGIRDTCQAEADLRLNKAMQVLTIITVVVLPLTLIAGWYGMNLNMPEYAFPYAYPAVLVLSAAVIGGCIWFFKKNKWF